MQNIVIPSKTSSALLSKQALLISSPNKANNVKRLTRT
jgi:hypothetical protein